MGRTSRLNVVFQPQKRKAEISGLLFSVLLCKVVRCFGNSSVRRRQLTLPPVYSILWINARGKKLQHVSTSRPTGAQFSR